MTARLRAFAAALILSLMHNGCGSSSPPPQPQDAALESSHKLARFALQTGNLAQAEILFERALSRAYERDDIVAIGDIGYEFAVAKLRNGRPEAAAEQARAVGEELERRGVSPFAELYLVEAVAAYEAGRAKAAQAAARKTLDRAASEEIATRGRAFFVLGMIAADAADAAGISDALAGLRGAEEPGLQADYLELNGRYAMLRGQPEKARREFEAAAGFRQLLEDYIGMARVLAQAGSAAEQAGRKGDAADLYFRAGRSAAKSETWDKAVTWLEKSASLAGVGGDSVLEEEAAKLLEFIESEKGEREAK